MTDLLIQQLGRASSIASVLKLLGDSRELTQQCGCESLLLLLYTAALCALGRCLVAPLAASHAALSLEDLSELQVRSFVFGLFLFLRLPVVMRVITHAVPCFCAWLQCKYLGT